MLARRQNQTFTGETPPLSSASTADSAVSVQATIDGNCELCPEKLSHIEIAPSTVPVVERSRAVSSVLENELLRQQLAAKAHELKICTQRVEELTNEMAAHRSKYEDQIEALEEKLRGYDIHVRGLGGQASHLDLLVANTRMLRSVRGGSQPTPLTGRSSSISQECRPDTQRQSSTGSDKLQSKWEVDDEVFPIAPINMESVVVKRLIRNLPEQSQEKVSKWLGFVLEGRDIRSNFHPEIAIEGISEEVNRDMRRLIVPLLKNRHDLKVQSYVRTRYVLVSDLKITLDHKHKDEVRLEATDDIASDDGATEGVSSLLWARDHLFYGPRSDASSPSVLHGSRTLATTKDRFKSVPVDLNASIIESKSMLEAPRSSPQLFRKPSLPFDSFSAPAPGSSPSRGGVFSRLRTKTGVGAMLGDVKIRLNARYHKNHVHEDALCDGCGMSPIVGSKWKCNTCDDVELCDGCYAAGVHGFEVSNELCRRVEQRAVQKHHLLGEYPELFELFRRHICHDNVIQFRRVVKWLCAIVSGARSKKIYHKMIVKSGLHPDIRARLVAQLGALASERADISLKTEWFAEKLDEEAVDSDNELESRPIELDGDKLSPMAVAPPNVQLETLRMYLTDASSSNGNEIEAPNALSDLLKVNCDDAGHSPTLRRTMSSTDDSAWGDHVGPLRNMRRQQSLDTADAPTYGSKRVKSVTQLNM
ncbi:Sequestosome-1 [Phytophthora citrophthora]|uniref:Sequestosome-1 n=1 Tax=Phytophthora citrophthora TaxID=4793 RepID=A0AAD9GUC3_9STRA|nr:Sequestosome-1 [Phytophthora citrophthora]